MLTYPTWMSKSQTRNRKKKIYKMRDEICWRITFSRLREVAALIVSNTKNLKINTTANEITTFKNRSKILFIISLIFIYNLFTLLLIHCLSALLLYCLSSVVSPLRCPACLQRGGGLAQWRATNTCYEPRNLLFISAFRRATPAIAPNRSL